MELAKTTKKVICIDHNSYLALMVKRVLNYYLDPKKVVVYEVESGDAGLEIMSLEGADMVFCEIDLPGTDVIPQAGTRQGVDVIRPVIRDAIDEVGAMVSKEIEEISSEVEEFVYRNKLDGQVDVTSDERGAIITISDTILFSSGTSRMNYKGTKTVKQIFELLNQFNYDVTIEGHTDDSPMRSDKFPSNWELSAARAADVARILVRQGFDPDRLSIQGFAEFRPKVPNDRPENRAVNRRIEIVYQRGSIKKNMVDILRRKRMIDPG